MNHSERRNFLKMSACSVASLALMGTAARSAQALISTGTELGEGWTPDYQAMIPVPGGNAYVRSNGEVKGGKTPLVLIHGGPGSCHANLTPALQYRGDRPIILYDQLDCGLSDAPGDPANWVIPRFVEELNAVLEHFGAENYHILGHSWGGTILLEHALTGAPRTKGMIFQGALISTERWIKDTDILRTQLPQETQDTLTECGTDFSSQPCDAALSEFYANFLARKERSPELDAYRARIDNLWNQALYEHMWGATEFVATGTLKDYDGTAHLDVLKDRAALFSTAEFDEARPETYRQFAEAADGAFEVVPDAGHAVFVDNPRGAMTAINHWLESEAENEHAGSQASA